MKYNEIKEGIFISRPNRFIAEVEIEGQTHTVHVKNTGRCKELLTVGCTVYLSPSSNPTRKTAFDLVAVLKERNGLPPLLINVDSQLPNAVAAEWILSSGLFSSNADIRREVTYKRSRFDLYVEDGERRAFVEVKGVTLEHDGVAAFPDAPTERGVRHLKELAESLSEGYEAYVLFVIQMRGVRSFSPNDKMHPEFGDTLRYAARAGVRILAYDCNVSPDKMSISSPVPVFL